MARLTKITFEHENAQYELDIDLDDAAAMEDHLALELVGRVITPDEEVHEIDIRVVVDVDEGIARVIFPDGSGRIIDLSELPTRINPDDEEAIDVEGGDGAVTDKPHDASETIPAGFYRARSGGRRGVCCSRRGLEEDPGQLQSCLYHPILRIQTPPHFTNIPELLA